MSPTLFALAFLTTRAPVIDTYVRPELKDAAFSAKIVFADQPALSKIGKDFGAPYKFTSAQVFLREPFQLRLESKYEGTVVVMVEHDARVSYHVPGIRLKPRDLTHSPGGRQTFLDFGVLTPSLVSSLFDATFVSQDVPGGTVTFDLAFKTSPDYKDTSRQRVVIDAAKHFVTRREWYGQDGVRKATFAYGDPVQIGGIWLPTDARVMNAEGKLAGETRAEDLKVNTGLADGLFAIK